MTSYREHVYFKNIYYMLSYAFRDLKLSGFKDVETEKFESAQDMFAEVLGRCIGQQLKQGLYREYINMREDIPGVRGRIDMPGTIRNMVAHKRLLFCEYDELSENTQSNQILKTTMLLLLRSKQVKKERKVVLKKDLVYFSNVDEILDPFTIPRSQTPLHRNNPAYRALVELCLLVLKNALPTTEKGKHRLQDFSFVKEKDMPDLYEKFILGYYKELSQKQRKKEAIELHVVGSKRVKWAGTEKRIETHKGILPEMKTDVMLTYNDEVLIIDAKLYQNITKEYHDTVGLISGHLYQVFAYVKNKSQEKDASSGKVPRAVSGMLLYARTDEGIQPDEAYYMSGNWVYVKTVDMNQDFSQIRAQLDTIAKNFEEGKLSTPPVPAATQTP